MITITFTSHIRLVNYIIEKISLLIEKCGVMTTVELTPVQHEYLINTINNGTKYDQDKAIKYCINLIDNNQQEFLIDDEEEVFKIHEYEYGFNFLK